jgi:hypothetical protein
VISIRIVTGYVMTFRRIRSHVDIVDVVVDSQVAHLGYSFHPGIPARFLVLSNAMPSITPIRLEGFQDIVTASSLNKTASDVLTLPI